MAKIPDEHYYTDFPCEKCPFKECLTTAITINVIIDGEEQIMYQCLRWRWYQRKLECLGPAIGGGKHMEDVNHG